MKTEKGPRKSKYSFLKEFHKISDTEFEIKLGSVNLKNIELLALAPSSIYSREYYEKEGVFKSNGVYYLEKWNKNDSLEMYINYLNENNRFPKN